MPRNHKVIDELPQCMNAWRGPEILHTGGSCGCCWLDTPVRWEILIVGDTEHFGGRRQTGAELGAPSPLPDFYRAGRHRVGC